MKHLLTVSIPATSHSDAATWGGGGGGGNCHPAPWFFFFFTCQLRGYSLARWWCIPPVLPYVYAYWVCAARETPIFSPEFPFRSISFSQISKKSVPEHHHFTFFGGFCRSGDHHFQNFFNFNPFIASHGRLSPNAKRSAAPRVSQTRPGSSGDWHFHAQNGSSSFRSPAFSSSKRLKLVPEPRIFTLDRELVPEPLPIFHFAAAHTYQNLGWVPLPHYVNFCHNLILRSKMCWSPPPPLPPSRWATFSGLAAQHRSILPPLKAGSHDAVFGCNACGCRGSQAIDSRMRIAAVGRRPQSLRSLVLTRRDWLHEIAVSAIRPTSVTRPRKVTFFPK